MVCLSLEEYAVTTAQPVRGDVDKIGRSRAGNLKLVAKDATRAWILNPGDPITPSVWDAARTCHTALGCRDYSLFNFRIDAAGRPWFLEAGLY